jgi:hypothetical protein
LTWDDYINIRLIQLRYRSRRTFLIGKTFAFITGSRKEWGVRGPFVWQMQSKGLSLSLGEKRGVSEYGSLQTLQI